MTRIVSAAACLAALLVAAPARAAQRPNIIVVLIDDMGWGDFSCFGNERAKTPQVDRLAAEGIRFSQFYVNAPICSPSRCALTTGQYPQRWKITSFLNNRAENRRRGMAQWLDPAAPTLARQLKGAGYATGHFGKWHLGGQRDVADAPPITRYGFDRSLTNFEGMGAKLLPETLAPGDEKPGRIWEDAERLGGPVTWTQRSQITTGFIDGAIPFMEAAREKGQPFYVNLWPDDVHSPFWPSVSDWREGKQDKYLAVLEGMDRQLGVLFDYVRSNPTLQGNTLIIVCSDNGPEGGAGSAGPFRGTKGQLYEGGIRSPLVVWGPGVLDRRSAGRHDETSVFAAFDLVPSLMKIAGATAPEGVTLDGEDVSPTLTGWAQESRKAPICWRRPPDRPGPPKHPLPDLAIRDGNWKLLCDYEGANVQLFDLSKDREERTNLADGEPEVMTRLRRTVVEWHQSLPPDNGPNLERGKDATP